ncbi:SurA N-terminal domain-containing protein [Thalassobacillus sp. CUG 92003]|uniref:SurA N-terminal domain-containing protein n=1 Tax=Thalassobacillus sp. CUG 92003 TaxID=2736641 RepID=UPI0015E70C3C|nr:SurA N-terminal domain-containing protein [Thalassobacillus sp. CUG 92003]
MKKTLLTIVLGAMFAIGLTACSGDEDSGNNNQSTEEETSGNDSSQESSESGESEGNPDEPVATVNGEEIPRKDLTSQMESMKQQYEQMGASIEGKEDQLQQNILDSLIGNELISQEAEKSDIEISDEEVNKRYDELPEEQRKQALEQGGYTEESLKKELKTSMKANKFVSNNTEDVNVTDEEIQAEYDKLKESQQDAPKLEEIKPRIKQTLQQQKQQEQIKKLVEELRNKEENEVEILI